jgi:hypothetical protein
MPCVGFEPTIPASERAKKVLALELSATVTGQVEFGASNFYAWVIVDWLFNLFM